MVGATRTVRPARLGLALAVVVAVLVGEVAGSAAATTGWPWQRTYVPTGPPKELLAQIADMFEQCEQAEQWGVVANGATGVPTVAVLGDSVQNQLRLPLLFDPAYRWVIATHCGESFGTAIDSGRLGQAMGAAPDIVVGGVGAHSWPWWGVTQETAYAVYLADLDRFLAATAGARCRVLYTTPETAPDYADPAERARWIALAQRGNAHLADLASRDPGLRIVDWAGMVRWVPGLLWDEQHLTAAGVNARINATIAAFRRCYPPDAPTGITATPGPGSATVSWDPLPPEEGVTAYVVTASDGTTRSTPVPWLTVEGLPDGQPVLFSVRATNRGGTSPPSPPSPAVTPRAAGSRFHPIVPTRVLDTRDGTGGRTGPIAGGESISVAPLQLVPEAAGAAAVALEVTAVWPTADTFVTVWPGDQPRPATSNLNVAPGVGVRAVQVTSPTGPGGTVQLFNNRGAVHLLVDVVGWYDAPGAGSGARYHPLAPTRALDTRDGTGGSARAFSPGETRSVALDAVPPDATAVALNLTSTGVSSPGHVTAWPDGAAQPTASMLNPARGRTDANLVLVALGENRRVALFSAAGTHLVADVVGWFGPTGAEAVDPDGAEYHVVRPHRRIDTRDGTGGVVGPLGPTDVALPLTGLAGVPAAGVLAVDATVTVVGPSDAGHLTLWPTGPRPQVSTLNYGTGDVVANRAIIGLAPDGTTRTWLAARQSHQLVDVSGWFAVPATSGASQAGSRAGRPAGVTQPWTVTAVALASPPTSSR
jgi:hypothetical protein